MMQQMPTEFFKKVLGNGRMPTTLDEDGEAVVA
jgi:hypothetical protein